MELVAQKLTKKYEDSTVVDGFDLSLKSGEVLGLLGPNGAGKSTIVGMLYGAVIPSSGLVRLESFDIHSVQGRQARSAMGVVTQDNNLDPDLDVFNNLIVFARYYHLTGQKAKTKIDELLDLVNLQHKAKANVEELSGGMKRKLILARALLGSPKIIFLDEPTTGLDPEARQEFWKLVSHLKDQNVGVLLTTHYMDEAERLCDRIVLLQNGKQVDSGSPQELIKRVVGERMLEVSGITKNDAEKLATKYEVWLRDFADGFLFAKPQSAELMNELQTLSPNTLFDRPANLEDVFLRLTGKRL
jgi:lipooligosaccharide transport system ATP-binding protein